MGAPVDSCPYIVQLKSKEVETELEKLNDGVNVFKLRALRYTSPSVLLASSQEVHKLEKKRAQRVLKDKTKVSLLIFLH